MSEQPKTEAVSPVRVDSEVQEAVDEWFEEWRQESKTKVKRMLDVGSKDIIMALMGFEKDSFGRGDNWRIDHCNGRDSLAANFMHSTTAVALDEWMKTGIAEFVKKKPPAKLIKDMQSVFEHEFREQLRRKVRHAAEAEAEKVAGEIAHEALQRVKPVTPAPVKVADANIRLGGKVADVDEDGDWT